jgi:hypothetical protein
MPRRVPIFRSVLLLALLCVVAAGVAHAQSASTPAILRTDAFIATPYDADTALVFFNTSVMPAGLGIPTGPWPQSATPWAGAQARLRLVNPGDEAQWRHYWLGGAEAAPHVGGVYVLALGRNEVVRGMLSGIGYLPVCDSTWLVGLVSVDAVDRTRYAGSVAEGMVAYLTPVGGLRVVRSSGEDGAVPAAGSTFGKDRILNVFPLDVLPMLDQGDRDSGNQKILLTEERTVDSVIYSLKRWTPGGLVPAGVYFENRCR